MQLNNYMSDDEKKFGDYKIVDKLKKENEKINQKYSFFSEKKVNFGEGSINFLQFKLSTMFNTTLYPSILIIDSGIDQGTDLIKKIIKVSKIKNGIIFRDEKDLLKQSPEINFENETTIKENYTDKMVGEYLESKIEERRKKKDKRILAVFYSLLTKGGSNIIEIILNGRHYRIPFLVFQEKSGLCPVIRSNFDYVFLFIRTEKEKQKLYDDYCGMFPEFDQFNSMLKKFSFDVDCIVINNRSKKIEDMISFYSL